MDESTLKRASSEDIRFEYIVPKNHLTLINTWLSGHGLNLIKGSELSENGVLVYVNDSPEGFGFVYGNTNICEFNGGLINPELEKKYRSLVIDKATEGLEILAKELGFVKIKIHANITRLISRLKDSGYNDAGKYTMLIKEL